MTPPLAQAPLRRAGRLPLGNGRELAWSMAEGSRGRRWRSNLLEGGRLVKVLLLEVDLRGRPARLEVSTAAGLLTLHPERDESMIHGNVVRGDGVEPLALAWSPEHELLVMGNVVPTLVALRRLAGSAGGGDRANVPALIVEDDLRVSEAGLDVRRTAETEWAVRTTAQAGEGTVDVAMSLDGLPLVERGLGARALEWALEAE